MFPTHCGKIKWVWSAFFHMWSLLALNETLKFSSFYIKFGYHDHFYSINMSLAEDKPTKGWKQWSHDSLLPNIITLHYLENWNFYQWISIGIFMDIFIKTTISKNIWCSRFAQSSKLKNVGNLKYEHMKSFSLINL